MIKKKNIKNKYFIITGNNSYKKELYKKKIKNFIQKYYKNIDILYFFINKKFNIFLIQKKLINLNFLNQKQLFIINFTEKIKKITQKIIEYIHIYHQNFFFILNFEYKTSLYEENLHKFFNDSFIIKFNNIKLNYIEKNKHTKYTQKNFLNINKYINDINIVSFFIYFKKKNIKKCLNIIRILQKNNFEKLLFLNLIFNYLKKLNINNKNNTLILFNIFNLIKKCETKIKTYNNPLWNDLEKIIILVIKNNIF